jgi:hypothetical protein
MLPSVSLGAAEKVFGLYELQIMKDWGKTTSLYGELMLGSGNGDSTHPSALALSKVCCRCCTNIGCKILVLKKSR